MVEGWDVHSHNSDNPGEVSAVVGMKTSLLRAPATDQETRPQTYTANSLAEGSLQAAAVSTMLTLQGALQWSPQTAVSQGTTVAPTSGNRPTRLGNQQGAKNTPQGNYRVGFGNPVRSVLSKCGKQSAYKPSPKLDSGAAAVWVGL